MESLQSLLCWFIVTTPSSSPSLMYCSPVWGSSANFHLQLERQVHAVSRLWPNQSRCDAGVSMLCKVHSNLKHFLYGELPSGCQS